MASFFPRYSPDGTRVTHEVQLGDGDPQNVRQSQWIDNNREIHHDGIHIWIDGKVTTFRALSVITAAGGKWAGYHAGDGAIYRSWADPIADAGEPALNANGDFAYLTPVHADFKTLVLNGVRLTIGGIWEMRISNTLLTWMDRGRTKALRLDGVDGVQDITAENEGRPIPIDVPGDVPWVLTQTDTGLLVRPVGSLFGYRFDNSGEAYYSDGCYRDGAIRLAYTDHSGNFGERVYPLTAPRVNVSIGPVTVPPPPVPPTPPVPPVPPKEPPVQEKPPTFDQWIRQEYPQVVAAWQYGHPHDDGRPNDWRPGDEWAAFQTLRRYSGFIPGMGERWDLADMIKHERSFRPSEAPSAPSEPPQSR